MAQPAPREVAAAYAGVQRAADREVLRVLRDAYKDVNAQISRIARDRSAPAALKRARLLALKQGILEEQSKVFREIGKIVEARRTEAAARAIRVSGRYDQVLFDAIGEGALGRAVSRGLEETEAQAVDAAVARLNGSSTSLSQRVYRADVAVGRTLDRRINSALARGLNAEQFAREIQDFVNPATPGGQRYAALRLARTEINNAYHAMAVRAAQLKPWVNKVKWNLSLSHPRPDECNELAGRLYAPDAVPRKPHPMCLCFITPEIDDSPEGDEDFLDGLVSGEFDEFLDQFADRHSL